MEMEHTHRYSSKTWWQSSFFSLPQFLKSLITAKHQHFSSNRTHLKKVQTLFYHIQPSLKFWQNVIIVFSPVSSYSNDFFFLEHHSGTACVLLIIQELLLYLKETYCPIQSWAEQVVHKEFSFQIQEQSTDKRFSQNVKRTAFK